MSNEIFLKILGKILNITLGKILGNLAAAKKFSYSTN